MLARPASVKKFHLYVILAMLFWYLSLYPGRLGFDYAEMARIIRRGESTAWWGASFFWFFKLLTFNLRTIAIVSFIGLSALLSSTWFFIRNLPISRRTQEIIFLSFLSTPLFGVFGLTVSHDVFQSSGILILTGLLVRLKFGAHLSRLDYFYLSLSATYLTTTQQGFVIFSLSVFLICWRRSFKPILSIFLLLLISFVSNSFINEKNNSSSFFGQFSARMILIDLKCIAQHPEAEITPSEWSVLLKYAPKEDWIKPVTCASPDVLGQAIDIFDHQFTLNPELLKTFYNVVSRQAAIPLMSHIQRSSVALPPPFFQPPPNQVSWDITQPIGTGTNVALQQGPELLHPSIDDPQLSSRPRFLRPLELFALLPAFLINQASWFWGWGGLWFWPLLILLIKLIRPRGFRSIFFVLTPTLTLHAIIFIIGPTSLGRYVMSTIIMGFISLTILLSQWLKKVQHSDS